MTRIDFHFNVADAVAYTCRVARKARAQGHQLVIFGSDVATMQRLDDELWSFSEAEFLPHCYADDELAKVTPILLTLQARDVAHHDVLINLGPEQPAFFSRFDRMIEVIETVEEQRVAGRARWRFYQDRGYALTRYDASGAST